MTHEERAAQWRCKDCKTEYAVPSLARECEARHAADLAQLQAVS